jgi:hypothetical protein
MTWHGAFLIKVLSVLDESLLSSAVAFDGNVGKGFGLQEVDHGVTYSGG